METLKSRYIKLCEEYSAKFASITDKQGEWSSGYDIWFTEFEAYSLDEVRYVVDNELELKSRFGDIGTELEDWVEYNIFAHEFKVAYINLKSWFNYAPRMSYSQQCKLRELKRALEIEQEKIVEQYGHTDETPTWVTNNLKHNTNNK